MYDLSVVGLFFAKWISNSVSWPSLPTKKTTVPVVSKTIFRLFYPLLSPILTRMIQFHDSTRTQKFAFGVPRCMFFLTFPLEKQNINPIGSFSLGRMGPNRGPLVSWIQKATEQNGQPGCSECPKNNRKLTSPPYYMACLKMIFLFQRWDMLVLWRVLVGWNPAQFCGDYFIKNENKDPVIKQPGTFNGKHGLVFWAVAQVNELTAQRINQFTGFVP